MLISNFKCLSFRKNEIKVGIRKYGTREIMGNKILLRSYKCLFDNPMSSRLLRIRGSFMNDSLRNVKGTKRSNLSLFSMSSIIENANTQYEMNWESLSNDTDIMFAYPASFSPQSLGRIRHTEKNRNSPVKLLEGPQINII